MDKITSPHAYKNVVSKKKMLNIPKLKKTQKRAKEAWKTAMNDMDKIDGKLTRIWDLWNYRVSKILVPNCVSHIKSLISLIFHVMQIMIILETIRKKNGDLSDIHTIEITLFPIYGIVILKLVLQTSALMWTTHRALYVEHKLHFVNSFEELNRFLPVFEQCIPVITYLLMLVTSLSIGICHITNNNNESDFCQVFTVNVVQTFISLYIICQSLHYLIAIYHNKRHTSLPRKKYTSDDDHIIDHTDKKSVLNKLEDLNEDLTSSWQWWKYRMDRIFCAHLSHSICNLCDIILEGTTVLFIIRAVHKSNGNMTNIRNFPILLTPLYVKFFCKAFIQLSMMLYVSFVLFNREDSLKFLRHMSEPGKYKKVIEHFIPVLSYVIIGVLTMSIGQCHINPQLNTGQGICRLLPFTVVQSLLIGMAAIQFLHHIIAIYHYRTHTKEPKKNDDTDIVHETFIMEPTDNSVL